MSIFEPNFTKFERKVRFGHLKKKMILSKKDAIKEKIISFQKDGQKRKMMTKSI